MAIIFVLAVVGSLMAISIAKATQSSQSGIVSAKIANQANMYALGEAELQKSIAYTSLNSQAKTTIPNSAFQKEIIVSDESDYSDTTKQKSISIKIYKGEEKIPRAELTFYRYNVEQKVVNGIPIGTIITWPSNINPTDGAWLECNGQSCSSYPALVAVLGKNTVPDYRGRFLESDSVAGTIKEAGLPNISGTIPARMSWQGSTSNGALSIKSAYVANGCDGGKYDGTLSRTLSINASLSNSVYGKSSTVQPASVTVRRLIKAA